MSIVAREATLALAALQYFTRIPVPSFVGHSQAQLNDAARYFPLVGALVGGVGAAVLWTASLVLPALVAVLLAMGATAWLTGAFHEDGLADTIDGLGGSFERSRALEIMRDSRIGTYGTLALLLVIGIKATSLAALPPAVAAGLFVIAHVVSRAAAVTLMASLAYVREDDSKSKPLVQHVSRTTLNTAVACAVLSLATLATAQWRAALASTAAALVTTWLWRRKLQRRLGGYTGDCLGATQQLVELAMYVAALAAWST